MGSITGRNSGSWHQQPWILVGQKLVKSTVVCGSCASCCFFLQRQKLLCLFVEQVTVNHDHSSYVAAICTMWLSSLFLDTSIPFSFVGLGRVKSKWELHELKDWANWLLSPLFLFWGGKFFTAEEFTLGTEECWLEEWSDEGKKNLSSCSFYVIILLVVVVPLCWWSFSSGLHSPHRTGFIHG